MIRFFVDGQEMLGEEIVLCGENAAHAKVLRLSQADEVVVCDAAGAECVCRALSIERDAVRLQVLSRRESTAEARVLVRVYLAFPKADKLEHVITKAVELGAREIVAFPSERCVSRPDEKSLSKKLVRWQKIAKSAAEQSGRGILPAVRVLSGFSAAVREAAEADVGILFYENEQGFSLGDALRANQGFRSVSLLTGPEGGLSEKEVHCAREAGLFVCTLGRRILRCETAPLCALSAVMFAAGEF